MKPKGNILYRFFKYIEPLWLDGRNKTISLKSVTAMALSVDFIINVHNSVSIVTKVLKLLFLEKPVDSTLIAAMSGNLAQIAIITATEAALIAALFGLKGYQAVKLDPGPQQQVLPEEKDKDQHIQL